MKPRGIPPTFRPLRMVRFHWLRLLKVQSCRSLLIDWMDKISCGGHNPWNCSLEEEIRSAMMILHTMSGMLRILWFYHGSLTQWNQRSTKLICISTLPNNYEMQWMRRTQIWAIPRKFTSWKQRSEIQHGNMFVTSYYNMLKSLWQELDLFYDLEWSCVEDSAQYQRTMEKDRDMEFLAGLNTDLD